MKSLKRELCSQACVFALPVAVAAVFPFEAVFFKASEAPRVREASAAFAELSPRAEAAALASAKTTWQSDAPAGRRMRMHLSLGDLPESRPKPLLDIDAGDAVAPAFRAVEYGIPAWSPSSAAPGPRKIAGTGPAVQPQAFPREELLADAFDDKERKNIR